MHSQKLHILNIPELDKIIIEIKDYFNYEVNTFNKKKDLIKKIDEDKKFIDNRTEGFETFVKEILRQDVDKLAEVAGVDKQLVKEAAIAYATAKNSMEFHGLGVTEHEQGSKTVMLNADLAMITGNIGRKEVDENPLRGQNNDQGAANMGCQPHQGAE